MASTGKPVRETGVACVCCRFSLISAFQGQIWEEIEVLYRRGAGDMAVSGIWYEICMPRDPHWLNKVKKGSMEIGETDTDSVHTELRLLGWLRLGNPDIVRTRELWATSPWVLKSREEEGIRAVFIFVSRNIAWQNQITIPWLSCFPCCVVDEGSVFGCVSGGVPEMEPRTFHMLGGILMVLIE